MKQRNENSGLIDLDALMREAESAPSLPTSSRADDSLEAVTADVTSTREIPAIAAEPTPPRAPEPLPAPAPAPAAAPAPVAASRPSRGRGRLLLGLVAVAAAMTVTITLARAPRPQAPPAAAVAVTTPAPPPPPRVETNPAPAPIDPNALPAATTAEAPAPPVTTAAAAAPRPKATVATPEPAATAKLDEIASAPADTKGDLGGAMRSAVGDRGNEGAAKTDEASGPSAGQVRPSQGAVVGAINSVLPAARACLGPDDAIRTGLVVFRSDGSVARIDLRGTKPEDACVKDALSKARVAPFADDTFATRVTVRP
jgi:hypothetical protein